jgi:DNA-binding NtrC family response regulator
MDGSDGLDVLRTAKLLHPTASVILMTGFGSVQTAVEAMKIGAFDFVQKPFKIEEMELRIAKATEHRRLKHEIDYLRHTQPDVYDFDRIVGASGALQRVLNIVRTDDLRLGELSPNQETGEHPPVIKKIPPAGIPLQEIERQVVVEALSMSNWVQKDAAELLSISPRVMNYKIKTLGIVLPRSRRAMSQSETETTPQPASAWTVSSVG